MTREEAIKFLAVIKVAYPTAYKDMDKANKLATVNMWQSTFATKPLKVMELAFEQFRKVSKFPPTVADMYEMLSSLYYAATKDALIASQYGDEDAVKRCNWIRMHTSSFRGDRLEFKPNYGSITKEDLLVLDAPEEGSQKLITIPKKYLEEDV